MYTYKGMQRLTGEKTTQKHTKKKERKIKEKKKNYGLPPKELFI